MRGSNFFVILSLASIADTDVTRNEVSTKWIYTSTGIKSIIREVVAEGAYTVETGMELKTLVNMETNMVLLLRD